MKLRPLRARFSAITWIIAGALAVAACGKGAEEPAVQAAPVAIPQPPPVGDQAGAHTLRYFAVASGQLETVRTPAEVPEGARGQVLVTYDDPALQGPWLYVADLGQKQGEHYSVRSMAREELEAQVAAARPKPKAEPAVDKAQVPGGQAAPAAGAADQDVVIFRTAWCGYCKKAAEYLKLKGVPFVEKDLEADPGARQDMMQRAQRAGFPANRLQGVPILSVKGKIIPGFDRNAIDRALAGQG